MDLVLTVMSIVIDGSFWNMSSNFSQGFVLYSSLTGTLTQLDLLFHLPPFLGFRWWFLRGEQEQVSSCHSSTNRGCGKPNNICFQPRVCQHPSSNQQRGTAVWTFSVCRIHVQLLRAFFLGHCDGHISTFSFNINLCFRRALQHRSPSSTLHAPC